MSEIEQTLLKYLNDNLAIIHGELVSPDTKLLEAGLLDSIGMVKLIAFIETNFHVKIQDDELSSELFDSARNLTNFVSAKIG